MLRVRLSRIRLSGNLKTSSLGLGLWRVCGTRHKGKDGAPWLGFHITSENTLHANPLLSRVCFALTSGALDYGYGTLFAMRKKTQPQLFWPLSQNPIEFRTEPNAM